MKKATKERRKRERLARLRENGERKKRDKKPSLEDLARRLVERGKYTQEEIESMSAEHLIGVCSLFFPSTRKRNESPTIPVVRGVRGMFRSH